MVVISGKHGQLANRLTLLSYFIVFARRNGVRVVAPALDEYAPYFLLTRDDSICRYPPRTGRSFGRAGTRHLIYKVCDVISRALVKIPFLRRFAGVSEASHEGSVDVASQEFRQTTAAHRVTFVRGWLFGCSGELVAAEIDALRTFFDPIDEIKEVVAQRVSSARRDGRPLIGVHLRRGDYAEWREGRYLFAVESYGALMERVSRLFPGTPPVFLVCSNELLSPSALPEADVVLAAGSDVEDLYSLAACDLIMGPPSTYSRWASLIGRAPLYVIEDIERVPSLGDFRPTMDLRAV